MLTKLSSFIWLGTIVLLVIAMIPLPYFYYIMLRFITCSTTGYLAYAHYKTFGLAPWVFVLAALAILFNPLIPVYSTKDFWIVIDLIAASILGIHFVLYKKKSD